MTTCKNCPEEIFKRDLPGMLPGHWYHRRIKQWPCKDYEDYRMACPNPYHRSIAEPVDE